MGYQQICWDSQMKNFILVGICYPQLQHHGLKGVGHVLPKGLGEHLQKEMGLQQIFWDSKISMPEQSCLRLSAQDELRDLLGMICTICLGQSA